MALFSGIDLGSTSTKAVILDDEGNIVGSNIVASGKDFRVSAKSVMEGLLRKIDVSLQDLSSFVTTGYGRFISGLDAKAVSEITCAAWGAHYLHPKARTVIDIGGQDSKAIKISAEGRVENFSLNDKCAAGTGRFLERIAVSLELELNEMVRLSISSNEKLPISSTCTVFAETEVISRISGGEPIESIVRGLHSALASRIHTLIVRLHPATDIFMCGGGAKNAALVKELTDLLGEEIVLPIDMDPRLVPAIGAALKAREKFVVH